MDPVSAHITQVINRHWNNQGIQIKELAKRLRLSKISLGAAKRGQRAYALDEVIRLSVYFEIAPYALIDRRLVVRQLPEEAQEELARRYKKRNQS